MIVNKMDMRDIYGNFLVVDQKKNHQQLQQ